jgi:hypothetical protein
MTQRMTVKVVFALLCLVCLAAVSVRAESQHEEDRRIVRQVDHIVIRVDSVADTQALWSLFSDPYPARRSSEYRAPGFSRHRRVPPTDCGRSSHRLR